MVKLKKTKKKSKKQSKKQNKQKNQTKKGAKKTISNMKKSKAEMEKEKQLLYYTVSYLLDKYSKQIVDLLYNKQNISEFDIAKKLNITVNQVRNMLYKLHDRGLVSYTRKKDKRKGWYIYYWTLEMKNCFEFLIAEENKQLFRLQHELKSKQTKTYYACPNKCVTMTEETALLHDFFCPDCGELLQPVSNETEIKKLQHEIAKHEQIIEKAKSLLEQYEVKPKVKAKEKKEKQKIKGEKVKVKKKLKVEKQAKKAKKTKAKKVKTRKAKVKKVKTVKAKTKKKKSKQNKAGKKLSKTKKQKKKQKSKQKQRKSKEKAKKKGKTKKFFRFLKL